MNADQEADLCVFVFICGFMSFPLELRLSLFAKSSNAFAMVFALDENALPESLQHSPGREVAVHRVPEDSLCKSQGFGRACEQMLGQLARMVHQIIVRHDSVHQPDAFGLSSRNHLAGEDQLFRFAVADKLNQSRTAAGAGNQTDVVFTEAKLRLVRRDVNVAGQSYLQTRAGARAVDCCQHRLLDRFKLVEKLGETVILCAKLFGVPVTLEVLYI